VPRVVEFITALGDAINRVYGTDAYTGLGYTMDPVDVIVSSPNPGVKELFSWHPKKDLLNVREVPFYGTWGDEHRKRHGIGLGLIQPDNPRSGEVKFYPSLTDLDVLGELKQMKTKFILFAASAGIQNRNVPDQLTQLAADVCVEAGYHVVRVGRTYQPQIDPSFRPNEEVVRSEPEIRGPWVIDLVDKLSVPGTMLAVEQAAGVFCAHSAICLAAWHMQRPVFLPMPERYYRGLWSVDDQFSFGRDRPSTFHCQFEEFSQAHLRTWLREVERGTW